MREAVNWDTAYSGSYRLAYDQAYRILADRHAAEDVAQEALISLWMKCHSAGRTHVSSPSGWIVAVSRYMAYSARRKRLMEIPSSSCSETITMTGDGGTERELIDSIARSLPWYLRRVWWLRYVKSASIDEITALTGHKRGTVKRYLNLARTMARQAVEVRQTPGSF